MNNSKKNKVKLSTIQMWNLTIITEVRNELKRAKMI